MSVTVVGDAFVDIIIPVQDTKLGETYHRRILTLCGGTANVAMQISNYTKNIKFVGKIGNDVFGNYFKQNLRDNGVKDLTFMDYDNPTGLCTSLVMKMEKEQ